MSIESVREWIDRHRPFTDSDGRQDVNIPRKLADSCGAFDILFSDGRDIYLLRPVGDSVLVVMTRAELRTLLGQPAPVSAEIAFQEKPEPADPQVCYTHPA